MKAIVPVAGGFACAAQAGAAAMHGDPLLALVFVITAVYLLTIAMEHAV